MIRRLLLVVLASSVVGAVGCSRSDHDVSVRAPKKSPQAARSASHVADACRLLSAQVTDEIVGIRRGTVARVDSASVDSVCEWVNASPRDRKTGRLTVSVRNEYKALTPEGLYKSFEGTSCNKELAIADGRACWQSSSALFQVFFVRKMTFGWVMYDGYPAGRLSSQRRAAIADRLARDVLSRI